MSNEQVLILGGGLMGLAIAHQLARRGIGVTVLSRRRSEAAASHMTPSSSLTAPSESQISQFEPKRPL